MDMPMEQLESNRDGSPRVRGPQTPRAEPAQISSVVNALIVNEILVPESSAHPGGGAPRRVREPTAASGDTEEAEKGAHAPLSQSAATAPGSLAARPLPVLGTVQRQRSAINVFAFQNVVYEVPTKEGTLRVLHGVSCRIPVHSLCGVLGPSGAGKSSLFDVLLGLVDVEHVTGNVPVQDKVSYVSQNFQLVVSETVYDVMWFYANMTMPKTMPKKRKRQLIEDILFTMDMHDTQDTYVGGVEAAYGVVLEGGLSSGQRRRLQVCAELISEPEIIILDEPTTGLDGTNALHLVRVLQRLCRNTNMTAVASLHQCRSEIIAELDHLMLLTHGRLAFTGSMPDALTTVRTYYRTMKARENPMEYVLEFLSEIPQAAADELNTLNNKGLSSHGTIDVKAKARKYKMEGDIRKSEAPGGGERVRVLVFRTARIYWYKWSIYNAFGPLFLVIITGGVMAILFLNCHKTVFADQQTFLNMLSVMVLNLCRNGVHTSAVCCFTRAMWYLERPKKLYTAAEAYMALVLFEVPMGFLMGMVCYLTVWIPVGWGYHAPDRLAQSLLLFMIGSNTFRALFASVQLSTRQATGPRIIALVSMMEACGGLFLKYRSIPMYFRWACFINPFFYCMMGTMKIEYTHYLYPHGRPVEQHINERYGWDAFSIQFPYLMLIALWAVFNIVAFCLFSLTDYSNLRMIDTEYGNAPVVRVVKRVTPFSGRGKKVGKEGSGDGMSEQIRKARDAGYGAVVFSRSVPIPLPPARVKQPCVLQYIDIVFKVLDTDGVPKEILRSVSFNIARTSMFAIMGPSGAGKSTLIQIMGGLPLSGYMRATYLAGLTHQNVGYVTADDTLPVLDTVEEVLMFYAEFTLATNMTRADKAERVLHVIGLLGLEGIQTTFVGGTLGAGVACRGISGGEKRRVSMGCALLKNPSTLLLDEPTSGLDSTRAMELMEILENLTRHGRTIIVTIHQPSLDIYMMFLHVMFLARGEVVYVGPPKLSAQAFQRATGLTMDASKNPADFILDCMVGLDHKDVLALKEKVPEGHGPVVPMEEHMMLFEEEAEEATRPTSVMRLRLVAHRLLRDIWRNPDHCLERVKFIIICVFVTALPYVDLSPNKLKTSELADRKGLNILMLIYYIVQASNTIPLIQQQRVLVMHEIKLGFYKPWEIYMSHLWVSAGLFATLTSVVGFFCTFMLAGYRTGYRFWIYGWANSWLICAFSETMAVILALVMPSYPAAIGTYSGPYSLIAIPMSGLLIATSDLPWCFRFIAYVNPMRYGAGAEVINQFGNRTLIKDDRSGLYVNYTFSGDSIVENMGYAIDTGNKYWNTGVLLSQGCVLALFGYRAVSRVVGSR